MSNAGPLSRRARLLLSLQGAGVRQRGHGGAVPADPEQPRGLPRAVPEARRPLPVRRPAEREPDGLREKRRR